MIPAEKSKTVQTEVKSAEGCSAQTAVSSKLLVD